MSKNSKDKSYYEKPRKIKHKQTSEKEECIKLTGKVVDSNHDVFLVQSEENADHKIQCTPSGKMRKHHIRIVLGDRVEIEISPYDLNKGRILYRSGK